MGWPCRSGPHVREAPSSRPEPEPAEMCPLSTFAGHQVAPDRTCFAPLLLDGRANGLFAKIFEPLGKQENPNEDHLRPLEASLALAPKHPAAAGDALIKTQGRDTPERTQCQPRASPIARQSQATEPWRAPPKLPQGNLLWVWHQWPPAALKPQGAGRQLRAQPALSSPRQCGRGRAVGTAPLALLALGADLSCLLLCLVDEARPP